MGDSDGDGAGDGDGDGNRQRWWVAVMGDNDVPPYFVRDFLCSRAAISVHL